MAEGGPAWVAADWGTSHLRLWLMDAGGAVLRRIDAPCGMSRLERDGYEPALLALLEGVLPAQGHLPVICCGMAGAAQGWCEAPYREVPCPAAAAEGAVEPELKDPRLRVRILPGLCQKAPADVMRGEETQIAGVLLGSPDFDGVVCLPGTHTKWADVRNGEVAGFKTFMTGELFDLLPRHSILRHSAAGADWDEAAFEEAVAQALSVPHALMAGLFGLRAEAILNKASAGTCRARLSGLLIGSELAAARALWGGRPVKLVGEHKLAALYQKALVQAGGAAENLDSEITTLNGLRAAYRALEEQTS